MKFSTDPLHNLENLIAKNTTKSISIYLLVILVVIGVIGCLPIIKIDISSQSRGLVRATQEPVTLSTIVNGKINIYNLKNNQTVIAGDTLLILTQDYLKTEEALNTSLLHHSKEELEDISAILIGKTDSIEDVAIQQNYHNFLAQKKELTIKIRQAQQNYNRNHILYKKGVIPKAEYETYVYNLRFSKQAKDQLITKQKADWQLQKHQLQERIKNLESKLQQIDAEKEKYVLIAPVSGTLENVLGLEKGSFINASQIIGSISPNTELVVENTVSPNDIGLLYIGQDVKFQLDTFNYNQWGMLEGTIIEIDKNITLQENASFFRVRCSLKTKELQLKNGYTTTVSKGMTLTTRYFITQRSLFDLLFDKVDDWLNPKII